MKQWIKVLVAGAIAVAAVAGVGMLVAGGVEDDSFQLSGQGKLQTETTKLSLHDPDVDKLI